MLDNISLKDKNSILTSIQNNRVAHLYFLYGMDSSLLIDTVYDFLSEILSANNCTDKKVLHQRLVDGMYSDLKLIEKDGSSVKLAQLTSVYNFLSMRSLEHNLRIVVICDAQTMSTQAQNSLLKTIEEPPNNSIIFLLGNSYNCLLSTILSRAQAVEVRSKDLFSLVSMDEQNYIISNIVDMILTGDIVKVFTISDKLSSDKNKIVDYLNFLLAYINQVNFYKKTSHRGYFNESQLNELANELSELCIINIAMHIQTTLKYIKQNVSPNLALQSLFISIQEEYHAENSGYQI